MWRPQWFILQLWPWSVMLISTFGKINLASLLLLAGCVGNKDSGMSVEPMSFSQLETEVLGLSCAFSSCHGAGAGGLTLDGESDYERLVGAPSTQVDGAVLVVPGDSESSYFMQKLRGEADVGDSMPPGALLDDVLLEQISGWINEGAQP